MKIFELTLLGTSSSQPAFGRFPTSQILRYHNDLYMIDCGEGAQIQLSNYKIRRNQIVTIFISHLHGDHIFGLPGVVTSFLHFSRTAPLRIIGPKGIKQYLETCIGLSGSYLNFELLIEEFDAETSLCLYEDNNLEVYSIPLVHRLPTMGFLFREKEQPGKLNPEKLGQFALSHEEMKMLKKGLAVERPSGEKIMPSEILLPKKPLRSYAFVSDTIYTPQIAEKLKGVDVIYHETTYLKDMEKEANMRMHATSVQAASIAAMAGVGKLITGHYSSRYKTLESFESECREIFARTYLGLEGSVYSIGD